MSKKIIEWDGMPSYNNCVTDRKFILRITNDEELKRLEEFVNQKILKKTKSLRLSKKKKEKKKIYKDQTPKLNTPKYPIYIVSRGRFEFAMRLTSRMLERMNVAYKIVIEQSEYENYSKHIDPEKILILPFENLNQGSIPARNWIWQHSKKLGFKRHWILDDNISYIYRLNDNKKNHVDSGVCFKVLEDFVDRYENVGIAGMNYNNFIHADEDHPPYFLNTRIYSCILLNNEIDYQWRGRYNEDADLSIRLLKDGLCSLLFNNFLCDKASTMTMEGGNTTELYKDNGRELMTRSLIEQHPDIVKATVRFKRIHHLVDYSSFRINELIKKSNVIVEKGNNEYNMVLFDFDKKSLTLTKQYENNLRRNKKESIPKIQTNKKNYFCEFPDCEVGCSRASDLKRHALSHLIIKSYTCQECSRKFTRKDSLNIHVNKQHENNLNKKNKESIPKIQTNKKNYFCEFPDCEVGCSRASDLKRHALSHLIIKSYTCQECSRKFTRKDSLNIHVNKQH